MALRRLGPGSALPPWVEILELEVFGQAWGALEAHEEAWLEEGLGYVLWGLSLDEAELLRIAVDPSHQGQGLGRRLLRESTEALRHQGVQAFHLEVRVSNASARHLYESEGWQALGRRKAYYRDGEDAMRYSLS